VKENVFVLIFIFPKINCNTEYDYEFFEQAQTSGEKKISFTLLSPSLSSDLIKRQLQEDW
jgi:hypothetical protein